MDDFKTATDLLGSGPWTHRAVAETLGVDLQHYRQMRLPTGNPGRRPAPADWPARLAPLAAALRAHSATLASLADSLEHPD